MAYPGKQQTSSLNYFPSETVLRHISILYFPFFLRDDDDHSPTASVTVRDKYYQAVFQAAREHRVPVNFWAYGGEGRPRSPRANWTQGDNFIGDPPHEPQGWYSVYNTDQSTLEIIRQFASINSSSSETTSVFSTLLVLFMILIFI